MQKIAGLTAAVSPRSRRTRSTGLVRGCADSRAWDDDGGDPDGNMGAVMAGDFGGVRVGLQIGWVAAGFADDRAESPYSCRTRLGPGEG